MIIHQLGDEGPGSVSLKISANVWNMSNIPMFIYRLHNFSLAFNVATLSADLNTVYLSTEVTDWVHWEVWMCHISEQVLWPILCRWNVLPVVTLFLKQISGASLVTQKLWTVIYLQKAILLLCIREDVWALCPSISSQSRANKCELRTYFNVVDHLNHILQNVLKFR